MTDYKSWPFKEADKIIKRHNGQLPAKGYVLFETGYGPSGVPHLGTFAEVLRTTMVRLAYEKLTGHPTKLIAFSDDMDGLRKVPTNVPNQDMLAQHLGKPLTEVPDPFGTHDSFAGHNNARLQAFLDQFGFEYDFRSSTAAYTSGAFDETLLKVLEKHDTIKNIILPTLGAERQATYSPFLPICPETRVVLQVPVVATDASNGTLVYQHNGKEIETKVTGGACKLQWKVDWAMRWVALAVDYEMSGKDLIDSVTLSSKITRALGSQPPENMIYELFLDEKGEKISKSKGNGLSLEDWLTYAPEETLSYYLFQNPQRAKRLYFDVIPKAADEYLSFLEKYPALEDEKKPDNAIWHIHHDAVPAASPLSFSLLLNLAAAANADNKDVLWGFIQRYAPGTSPENAPLLDKLAGYAVRYCQDYVIPNKQYKTPDAAEKTALLDLKAALETYQGDTEGSALQDVVFAVGKQHYSKETLRDWFKLLYQVLLGQEQGPRFGSFVALYGREETIKLIADKVS